MREDRENPSQSRIKDEDRPEEQMKVRIRLAFGQDVQTLKTSELLAKLNLGKIMERHRKVEFSFSSLFKALVLAKLERIEKQTELVDFLEQNKEVAQRLGFSRAPSNPVVSQFWNHVLDENLRCLVSYTAEKIKEQACLFGVRIELEGNAKEIRKIAQWDSDFETLCHKLDIRPLKYSLKSLLKAIAFGELGNFSSLWTTGIWLYRNKDLAQGLGLFSDIPQSFGEDLKYLVKNHPQALEEIRKLLRRKGCKIFSEEELSEVETRIQKAFPILKDNLESVESFAQKLSSRIHHSRSYPMGTAVKLLALLEIAFPVIRQKGKEVYQYLQGSREMLSQLGIEELPPYSCLASVRHDLKDLQAYREFRTEIVGGLLKEGAKEKPSQTASSEKEAHSPLERKREIPLCPSCQANTDVVRCGTRKLRDRKKQRWHCKRCNIKFVEVKEKEGYSEEIKNKARELSQEMSSREVSQWFKQNKDLEICYVTILNWVGEKDSSRKPESRAEQGEPSDYQVKQLAWKLFNDGSSREIEEVIAELNQRFSMDLDSSKIESWILQEIKKRKGRRCKEMKCFRPPYEGQTWGWCKRQREQRSKEQYICAKRAYSLSRGLRRKNS